MTVILATALAVIALFAVVIVVHVEQRDEAARRSSDAAASQHEHVVSPRPGAGVLTPAWTAPLRGAESVDELAAASFPRARMGYAPLAVRAVLAHMAAAYADLAAASDPAVVADAWDRSRRRLAPGPGSGGHVPGAHVGGGHVGGGHVAGDAAPANRRPADEEHGENDAGQPAAAPAPTPAHSGDRPPQAGAEKERDSGDGT